MNQPFPPYDEPAGFPEPEPLISHAETSPDDSSTNIDQIPLDLRAGNHDFRVKAAEESGQSFVPSEVRRRRRRWLLGCGIPILLILLISLTGLFSLIRRGVNEVRGMEPWPAPEILPEELVAVDLSHLGLEAGQKQNVSDGEEWAGGSYEKGVLIQYEYDGESVIYIWALRYENKQAARKDYSSAQAWAGTAGNCIRSTYAYFGYSGVVHCQFSNAYDKIFWSDFWIVDIVALEGTEFTPDVLVDKVRDAVAAHWKSIEAP